MSDRRFRFGVVGGLQDDLAGWTRVAKWAEDAGYDILLSPDTPNVGSPFVSLAAAAAVTTRLRLGTFVLATPTRTPGMIAWESASLDRLSGGRFELGLGAGRPDAAQEAELLGAPWGSGKRRVEQVAETITGVRQVHADAVARAAAAKGGFGAHPFLRPEQPDLPVMVAGAGTQLLGVAARQADIIALGVGGSAGEDAVAEKVNLVREQAGDRFDDVELSLNIWAAGESAVPAWMAGAFGLDLSTAVDNRVVAVLNGTPDEIADVLLRRRDELGVSYITVNSLAMEGFAPVIERLAGK
ncbi:MAG TPA: TIGR03621 family F420-dependent LLM class oxidoreductase [Pseudonocardiaceae bacterium]|nr:TIGR03621 family F420-dependent LLM class oxidoreductase [Pseudonocardiaceae bacterium]